MAYLIRFVILTILLSSVGCKPKRVEVDTSMFTINYYPNKYADRFLVQTLPDSSAMLLRIDGERPNRSRAKSALLILNEEQIAPEEFDGAVIYGGARRIVSFSTSAISMLDSLGEAGRIVGIHRLDTTMSETIAHNLRRGQLLELGYGADINYDAIIALHPDIVLLSVIDEGVDTIATRLERLNIPYIYINDHMEEASEFAQKEWVVALATIIGRAGDGAQHFKSMEDRYESLLMAEIGYMEAYIEPSELEKIE